MTFKFQRLVNEDNEKNLKSNTSLKVKVSK